MKNHFDVSQFRVLLIAAVMSVVGTTALALWLPRSDFETFDLIPPSCVPWSLLAGLVKNRSFFRAVIVGVISPFLGARFVLSFGSDRLIQLDAVRLFDPRIYYSGMVLGNISLTETAPVTFPVGIATGLLRRRSLSDASENTR